MNEHRNNISIVSNHDYTDHVINTRCTILQFIYGEKRIFTIHQYENTI